MALASQLAIGWIVWREIRRRFRDDKASHATLVMLSSALLFSTFQLQSIVFPAAVMFPLVQHPITSVVYSTADRLRAAGDADLTEPAIGAPLPTSSAVAACDGSFRGNGEAVCSVQALVTPEPIRVVLDAPAGIVTGTTVGGGWAFQCDGTIKGIAIFVDGIEQRAIRLERPVPRPDVRAAHARLCDLSEEPGFSFLLDPRKLSTGAHRVSVRVVDAEGSVTDSNATRIDVRRP